MYRAAVHIEYDIVPVQSVLMDHYFVFSHFWFAIPQEVLHADWQDVWHSPQPSLRTLSFMSFVLIVLILFIILSPCRNFLYSIPAGPIAQDYFTMILTVTVLASGLYIVLPAALTLTVIL